MKLVTKENEVFYGQLHSYMPHTLLTLLVFPTKEALLESSVSNHTNTRNSNFLSISPTFVQSVEAIEKEKLRKANNSNFEDKRPMIEKFAEKINAPSYIPPETLGKNFRNPNNRVILNQQEKFKLAKLGKPLHLDGRLILKHLSKIVNIDSIEIDDNNAILLKIHQIKIIKPYKTSDVKYIGNEIIKNNKNDKNSGIINSIKQKVDDAWKELDERQKGG